MKMPSAFFVALVFTLSLVFTPSPTLAQQLELKFGHVGEPGSLYALSAEEFARLANARLGDKAKVVVFGSSQLGGDRELLQKLKLGTIDFALPATVMSTEVDLFGLFELPYLVRDRAHMQRIEKELFWTTLAPAAEKRGYKILAIWENGFRHITNNKRPIVTPADLQGIKLRVPEGKWRVAMFKTYGANPSPMKLSEVFVALQTGVMDGQENPLTQIYSQKFHEAQKYLSLSNHVYAPAYLAISTTRFEGLPKDVQKIIADTARETQKFVYETAAREEKDLLDKLKASSIKINKVDTDAFVKASKPIYEDFAREVPGAQDLIDKVMKSAGRSNAPKIVGSGK